MLTKRLYMRVRMALVARRYRAVAEVTEAVAEETKAYALTRGDVFALPASGHTLAEARNRFRLVPAGLHQKRKLPRDMAVRLVRPRQQANRAAKSF